MKVTSVRVYPNEGLTTDRLLAHVSITLDDAFIVNDMKIIRGNMRPFVAMPARKRDNDGKWHDVCHPLIPELRQDIEDMVLAEYRRLLAMEERGEVVR